MTLTGGYVVAAGIRRPADEANEMSVDDVIAFAANIFERLYVADLNAPVVIINQASFL